MTAKQSVLYALGEAWLVLDADAPLAAADAFRPRLGGMAAQLSTAFAAQGGQASLLTQLGDDAFGHRIEAQLSACGVDTRHLVFTPDARTPLLFSGEDGLLPYRSFSADLRFAPAQLPHGLFQAGDALAFSSACLLDSPMRHTHLAAIASARDAGAWVCFLPLTRPALWDSPAFLAETVRLFLPRADLVFLREDEFPLLFHTDAFRVTLFSLLCGHTQLVFLLCADGVHVFTRTAHAFRAGAVPETEPFAAAMLHTLMGQYSGPDRLARLTGQDLSALLSI